MSQIGFVLAVFALSLVVVYSLRATKKKNCPESTRPYRYPNYEYCATINYTNRCCHPYTTSGDFDRSLCTVTEPVLAGRGNCKCSCDIRCYHNGDCCSDVFCSTSKNNNIIVS